MINYITTHSKSLYYKVLNKMNLCECGLTDDSATEQINTLKDALNKAERWYYRKQGIVKLDKNKLRDWSKRVRKVQECDICGTPDNLTAHHLWDKRMHPTLMYQDENGVCLCTKHHNGFHKEYTSKSHTSPAMYNKYRAVQKSAILVEQNRKERYEK